LKSKKKSDSRSNVSEDLSGESRNKDANGHKPVELYIGKINS